MVPINLLNGGQSEKNSQKENDKFRDRIKKLSKHFAKFKDKMGCEPPNEQGVRFLSDGDDDLVKSGKGMAEELRN